MTDDKKLEHPWYQKSVNYGLTNLAVVFSIPTCITAKKYICYKMGIKRNQVAVHTFVIPSGLQTVNLHIPGRALYFLKEENFVPLWEEMKRSMK